MRLLKNNEFTGVVSFSEIHGAFPYKLYAEVIGSNAYGKFIVIVSNREIKVEGDKITVEFSADSSTKYRTSRYSAKVISPLDVKNNNLMLTVYTVD